MRSSPPPWEILKIFTIETDAQNYITSTLPQRVTFTLNSQPGDDQNYQSYTERPNYEIKELLLPVQCCFPNFGEFTLNGIRYRKDEKSQRWQPFISTDQSLNAPHCCIKHHPRGGNLLLKNK